MAELAGGLGTSHVSSIAMALDRGLSNEAEWKPFFDGYVPAKQWSADKQPDIAVVISNDHRNNFFLDRIPTLAVGVAQSYQAADEGWGRRDIPVFDGAEEFAWHFVDSLVERHLDPLICREIDVDHGVQVPMELFCGRPATRWPTKIVPVLLNTIQYLVPTPQRCWDLGNALRAAIDAWPGNERFVVLGNGGSSHPIQDKRARFINQTADRHWLNNIGPDPEQCRTMTREDHVEQYGNEGAEFFMWLVMRAAMNKDVTQIMSHYHAPASMTGAGMVVLENA